MLGILGRRGGDQHQWLIAGRRVDVVKRRFPHQRPDDVHVTRPPPRILELGEGADKDQPLAQPSVKPLDGRQAELCPGLVQLGSALPEPGLHQVLERPPDATADRGSGRAGTERVGRVTWQADRVEVRNQRHRRDPLELCRKRGSEREDVVHHHVRVRPGDGRPRLGAREHNGLVRLQRALAGREDRVFGRRDELHPRRLDVGTPP